MKVSDISVDLIGSYGDDLTVANAARVSFNKESWWEFNPEFESNTLSEKDSKLINYLAKHKHFSPFNHSFISVRVKAPIFVARQLVKHKFMPWNEVSRRYVDGEIEFYMPEFRARADNVKQGSSESVVEEITYSEWRMAVPPEEAVEDHNIKSYKLYLDLLESNIAPEIARGVLPQTMMTTWIWSGTLGAFCDMLRLRLDPHTQYESRIVAQKIREIIEPEFPVSVKALLDA